VGKWSGSGVGDGVTVTLGVIVTDGVVVDVTVTLGVVVGVIVTLGVVVGEGEGAGLVSMSD